MFFAFVLKWRAVNICKWHSWYGLNTGWCQIKFRTPPWAPKSTLRSPCVSWVNYFKSNQLQYMQWRSRCSAAEHLSLHLGVWVADSFQVANDVLFKIKKKEDQFQIVNMKQKSWPPLKMSALINRYEVIRCKQFAGF